MKGSAVRGRILAVDDSVLIRELLVAQLESAGYSVLAVDCGRAALDAVARENFDVVILDVQMPDMDGVEVGRLLRSNPRTARTVIAMHTTMTEAAVRERFSGYDAFLQKPCDARQLGQRIDALVREPRRWH